MLADRPKGKVVAAVQSVPWDVGTSSRMGKQGALPSSIMAVQRFHGHLFGKQGWIQAGALGGGHFSATSASSSAACPAPCCCCLASSASSGFKYTSSTCEGTAVQGVG